MRGPRLRLRSVDGEGGGEAPLLDTDVRMEISGMTARVVVKQRFRNPGEQWVEGVYVFPLPEAAVDRMRLRIRVAGSGDLGGFGGGWARDTDQVPARLADHPAAAGAGRGAGQPGGHGDSAGAGFPPGPAGEPPPRHRAPGG
ncbi:MAG: VIT domain-containing protein [Candidatus Sedimenticola endophacoides]